MSDRLGYRRPVRAAGLLGSPPPGGAFIADVTDRVYRLAGFGDDDMQQAAELVSTYAGMNIGLADASVAVLAGRYRTVDLFSVEQHFRAIKPLWGNAFRLLPLDA